MTLRVGSTCTGYGGNDLGFEKAGFEIAWQMEIDRWACALLRRYWPHIPNFGDLNDWRTAALAPVDVIVGGTPCQDLSPGGSRQGLDGEKSKLFWSFCALADGLGIPWVVWENSFGALSAPDFDTGGAWEQIIYGFTGATVHRPSYGTGKKAGWPNAGFVNGPKRWMVWRVLDAQYFGVPQRRRRVIVVAGPRSKPAPGVLFDAGSVPRDLGSRPSSRKVAACLTTVCPGRRLQPEQIHTSEVIAMNLASITSGENRANPCPGGPAPTLCARSEVLGFNCSQDPISGPLSGPLAVRSDAAVITPSGPHVVGHHEDGTPIHWGDPRVYTPVERERLMGLPDDWTEWGIDDSGHRIEISTTQRVKLTGNGMVREMAEWIAHRLKNAIQEGS